MTFIRCNRKKKINHPQWGSNPTTYGLLFHMFSYEIKINRLDFDSNAEPDSDQDPDSDSDPSVL